MKPILSRILDSGAQEAPTIALLPASLSNAGDYSFTCQTLATAHKPIRVPGATYSCDLHSQADSKAPNMDVQDSSLSPKEVSLRSRCPQVAVGHYKDVVTLT